MADIKVSEMTEATTFDDNDYTMIVQANQSKKITKTNMLNDINNNIGDITTLETTDKSNLVNAINEIENFLNINSFETITSGSITGGGTLSNINITVAKNNDGTLAKIYGQIDVSTGGHSGDITIQTSLRPTSQITINGAIYRSISTGGYVRNNSIVSFTLDTNGNVIIPYVYTISSSDICRLSLIACLIYIKDFNDEETD